MSILRLPGLRRYSQIGSLEIDWSNPITRSLVIAINGNKSDINLATRRPVIATNGAQTGTGKVGSGITFPSTSSTGIKVNTATLLRGSGGNGSGITIAILADPVASSNRIMGMCIGGNSPEWYISFNANSALTASSGTFSASLWGTSGNEGVQNAVDGKTHLFSVVYPEGGTSTSPNLYVDGVGPTIESPTSSFPPASASDFVAGYASGGFAVSGFNQYLTLGFNRALRPEEIRSLAANPWQIFKSSQRVVMLAASGSTYSVSETFSSNDSYGASIINGTSTTEFITLAD